MRDANPALPHTQRGLALITAVLVVAIVATTAATLALGEQVWLRQSQNMADRAQAVSLRQGALNYAAILLARDLTLNNNNVDHLGELWAQPLPPLPVEGGMIAFRVSDAQGLFNLNNLVTNGAPSTTDIEMFRRLLESLLLNPELRYALLDWLDIDNNVSPAGAEDTEYLALSKPYRAANRLLESVDELRLIRGFDAKTVEKLRPYVVALPGRTTVNVNTAPELLLAALFTTPPLAALKLLIDSRTSQPFMDPANFASRVPPSNVPLASLYGVTTSYFLVNIDIRYGRLQRRTLALIQRAAGKPAVILWQQLPPLQFETDKDEKT